MEPRCRWLGKRFNFPWNRMICVQFFRSVWVIHTVFGRRFFFWLESWAMLPHAQRWNCILVFCLHFFVCSLSKHFGSVEFHPMKWHTAQKHTHHTTHSPEKMVENQRKIENLPILTFSCSSTRTLCVSSAILNPSLVVYLFSRVPVSLAEFVVFRVRRCSRCVDVHVASLRVYRYALRVLWLPVYAWRVCMCVRERERAAAKRRHGHCVFVSQPTRSAPSTMTLARPQKLWMDGYVCVVVVAVRCTYVWSGAACARDSICVARHAACSAEQYVRYMYRHVDAHPATHVRRSHNEFCALRSCVWVGMCGQASIGMLFCRLRTTYPNADHYKFRRVAMDSVWMFSKWSWAYLGKKKNKSSFVLSKEAAAKLSESELVECRATRPNTLSM